MIIGEALGAWFEDRDRQVATMSAMEDLARRFRQLPLFSGLLEEVRTAELEGVDAVLDVARRFIERPGLAAEPVAMLAAAAAKDPFYRPHFRLAASEVHSGLLLVDNPALTVMLAVIEADAVAAKRSQRRGGASIIFTGRRSIFHFLKAGGATLSFWEAPRIEAGFTVETSGRCRLVERRRIRDGETIELDGTRSTFVVDQTPQDLVYLQATTPLGAAPLTAEYDSESLSFVGASSTDEASSRTQMMLTLLRIMGRHDAVPIFREMLSSEHFYARWQTMREFLALDAEAALPHLRQMAAADPHPEVREAAARTLAQFFPEASISEKEADACLA